MATAPALLAAYQHHDVDVHRRTAAAVLGITEKEVTSEQRNAFGKPVNFAIIYGTTPYGLSQQLGVSEYEAEQMLNGYFAAHPGVRQWIDKVHSNVRRHGHVQTLLGHRRQLPDVWAADPGVAAHGLRQAVNTIIQGTAAELMKLALVRLHTELPPEVRMLMTCHDSVLLEVPVDLVTETRHITAAVMESIPPGFNVPIRVNIGVGFTWAACKGG
jgi:DNA polymerase-1